MCASMAWRRARRGAGGFAGVAPVRAVFSRLMVSRSDSSATGLPSFARCCSAQSTAPSSVGDRWSDGRLSTGRPSPRALRTWMWCASTRECFGTKRLCFEAGAGVGLRWSHGIPSWQPLAGSLRRGALQPCLTSRNPLSKRTGRLRGRERVLHPADAWGGTSGAGGATGPSVMAARGEVGEQPRRRNSAGAMSGWSPSR